MSTRKYKMVFQKVGLWLYRGYLLKQKHRKGKWCVTHINGTPVPDLVDFKTRAAAANELSKKLTNEGVV